MAGGGGGGLFRFWLRVLCDCGGGLGGVVREGVGVISDYLAWCWLTTS